MLDCATTTDEVDEVSVPASCLAQLLRLRLKERGWTYGELADRVGDAYPTGVSEDRIKDLVSLTTPFKLPRRDRRQYNAFEAVIGALDIDLIDALETFSDAEIRQSIYAPHISVIARRRGTTGAPGMRPPLAQVISSLPATESELLALPGILRSSNAEAFAYMFALERAFSGLQMLISHEPPLMFFDDEDLDRLIQGMALDVTDATTFRRHFEQYRRHFRARAFASETHYRVLLIRDTFQAFLRSKSREAARALLMDLRTFIGLPTFELLFVDTDHNQDEIEIICKHREVPADLSDTLSVMIRRTPVGHDRFEYVLVPMPQQMISLRRDRNTIDGMWALGIDRARSAAAELGFNPGPSVPVTAVTAATLENMRHYFI